MTLHDHIAALAHRPFAEGRHDCATFARDWVLAATGRDPLQGYRHPNIRAGLRWLKRRGFDRPEDFAAAHLPEVAPCLARLGDLALVDDAMGIVGGEFVYVLRPDGLGLVPLTHARRAFRVGD